MEFWISADNITAFKQCRLYTINNWIGCDGSEKEIRKLSEVNEEADDKLLEMSFFGENKYIICIESVNV